MHVAILALLLPTTLTAQAQRPPTRLTVVSDGHPLALWARTAVRPRGVIVLLHGRTWSALPDFDLQVPGERLSVMQALVARGYSVYALDARGYGATPRDSSGWLTPSRAANDVAAVLRFVSLRQPTLPKPTLVGWSYGSMVAHLALQQHPTLASGVVLFGFPYDDVRKSPVAADSGEPPREANTAQNAASDFIAPNAISPRAIEAYVAAALKADPVRSDWKALHEWNELSAAKLTVPTLLLHGELDPYAPIANQATVFSHLGSPDRQWIILAGGDHAALLEATLPAFIAAITNFIERPRLP
ncbi:MAG: alpha/beta fold hydrolase [Gemmatimonadaceae bacterium]|nr:alpha/beta fold hydrolase [Gemmatimonadaceae bacterium]